MKFTRHNVILPSGEATLAGKSPIRETERFKSVVRTLGLAFPTAEVGQIRIADLGCLEGGYSYELARLGYQVLGIEARERHYQRCLYLAESIGLPKLTFAHDDVRNIAAYGTFDAVYASGILYHLDNPCAFLALLGEITRKVLILNTHFAAESIPSRFRHKLSRLTKNEGKSGRWYREWPKDTPADEVEKLSRSSVGNYRSFWLRKDSLLESMREAGFTIVYEQFDCHYDMAKGLQAIRRNDRGMFVGLKEG